MGGGVFMGWGGPDLKGGALRSRLADFLAIEVKRFPPGRHKQTKRFFIPAKPERSASAALKASSEA